MLQRLTDAGLAINVEKCKLGVDSVDFLGHTVSAEGITPKSEKVQAFLDMQQPTTKVEMQRFLGCINFYHRFIPHLASVLAPLHALCSSVKSASAALSWSSLLSKSFHDAKKALASFVLLAHPDPDTSKSLSLTTDASDVAVGAVLSQGPDDRPLGFYSKKLSEAEKKYSAFDKELLALYLSIKHFRCHLEGRHFNVWTDHKPLCGAIGSSTDRSPRQSRHLSFIAEFTTDIRHVPGASNVVADCLSRPSAYPGTTSPTLATPSSPETSPRSSTRPLPPPSTSSQPTSAPLTSSQPMSMPLTPSRPTPSYASVVSSRPSPLVAAVESREVDLLQLAREQF